METIKTRKSYLIRAIRSRLYKIARSWSKSLITIITLTGIVIFNINEKIIHLTLSISIINNKKLELDSICLKQLQEKLQDVFYFIIDKKSIVGRQIFGLINMRLKEAFSKNNNKPFNNWLIIIFGNFEQLLLVLDLPIYTSTIS